MYDVMTTNYPRCSIYKGTKEDCERYLQQVKRDGGATHNLEIKERVIHSKL